MEERVAQLEAQGKLDHDFMRELAAAVRMLGESNEQLRQNQQNIDKSQQEHTAMDLQLRQAMAAAKGKAEADIVEAAKMAAQPMDPKFN